MTIYWVGAGYRHGLMKSSVLCHECHSQGNWCSCAEGASLSRLSTQCGTLKIISLGGDSSFDNYVSLVVIDLLPSEGTNSLVLSKSKAAVGAQPQDSLVALTSQFFTSVETVKIILMTHPDIYVGWQ